MFRDPRGGQAWRLKKKLLFLARPRLRTCRIHSTVARVAPSQHDNGGVKGVQRDCDEGGRAVTRPSCPSSKKLVRLSFFFGISVHTNYQQQKQHSQPPFASPPFHRRGKLLATSSISQHNHTRRARKHHLWGVLVLGAPFPNRECKPPNMSSAPLRKHPSWAFLCSTPLTEHENTQRWCFCARRPRSFTFFICVFSATSMYVYIFNLSL